MNDSPAADTLRSRVLVVDDELPIRQTLAALIDDHGCEALVAADRASALELARTQGFDVAVVDLVLPDGDGTLLAAELREVCPLAEAVLLTGHATVETAVSAVRAGCFAYLVKPCAPDQLLLTVDQALRQSLLKREKKALAVRAQQAERLAAVGTMTAGLSHEIRNPLNAASLQLQVLERRVKKLPAPQQAELTEPLGLVRDEIARLDRVLEDFLRFARPRSIRPVALELGPVVDGVVRLLGEQAASKGIALVPPLPPLPTVLGDADALRQVLVNLVLNALDATPPGGEVRVRISEQPERITLSVEDTGPGIPLELRERIFEPFFTTKAQGSGLGLPLVHQIVGQLGGVITVSEEAGGGARVSVSLQRTR